MPSIHDLRLLQAQIDAANIDPILESELLYLIDDLAGIHHMLDEAELPSDPQAHEDSTLPQRFLRLLSLYQRAVQPASQADPRPSPTTTSKQLTFFQGDSHE
jgi:hypothetical protein